MNYRPFPFLILIASVGLVAWVRPLLASRYEAMRVTNDVLALPAPDHAVVMSLGYRSALADLLFSKVLVDSGIHVQERRRYEFVGEYLDVINALDPKYRSPYKYADTLLVLQALPARVQEYRKAREIVVRGLREFPYDAELWTNAGQYLAYLAAPHLTDPSEREEWRVSGARLLARACELRGPSGGPLDNCITAAGILDKAGERNATVAFLARFLTVSEDPALRRLASSYLDKLEEERRKEEAQEREARLHDTWRKTLPFVSRERLVMLAPPFDPAHCAGREGQGACATSWRALASRPSTTAPELTERP